MIQADNKEGNTTFGRINSGRKSMWGNAYSGIDGNINRLIDILEKYASEMEKPDIVEIEKNIASLKQQMDGVMLMLQGAWSAEDIYSAFCNMSNSYYNVNEGFEELYDNAVKMGILDEHAILEDLADDSTKGAEEWSEYLHGQLDEFVRNALNQMQEINMLPHTHPQKEKDFEL